MSSLCLPDSLTPLLMHVEPLLAAADKYQLGEQVSVDWSESGIVDIQIEERQFGLVYNQAEADIAGYKVLDQWMAPYPELSEIQQQVAEDPSLVVCGLPTEKAVSIFGTIMVKPEQCTATMPVPANHSVQCCWLLWLWITRWKMRLRYLVPMPVVILKPMLTVMAKLAGR